MGLSEEVEATGDTHKCRENCPFQAYWIR